MGLLCSTFAGLSHRDAQSMEMFPNVRLRHELQPAQRGSRCYTARTSRPKIPISYTPPHCLSMRVSSSTGISSVHLFWHFWGRQGHLFLVGLTSAACHFNANLSIHRQKLVLGQADFQVSKVFLQGRRLVRGTKEKGP